MKEMIARVGDSINKDGIASVCLTGEELVRCKDCKWYDKQENWCISLDITEQGDDWFCADSERK